MWCDQVPPRSKGHSWMHAWKEPLFLATMTTTCGQIHWKRRMPREFLKCEAFCPPQKNALKEREKAEKSFIFCFPFITHTRLSQDCFRPLFFSLIMIINDTCSYTFFRHEQNRELLINTTCDKVSLVIEWAAAEGAVKGFCTLLLLWFLVLFTRL